MEYKTAPAGEWTKEIKSKNKTKSRHIEIDRVLYCLIKPTKNAMVSFKDGLPCESKVRL